MLEQSLQSAERAASSPDQAAVDGRIAGHDTAVSHAEQAKAATEQPEDEAGPAELVVYDAAPAVSGENDELLTSAQLNVARAFDGMVMRAAEEPEQGRLIA